ncbi:MAG: GNAT family N-acetyltransferase [Bacteroidota bacterium]
MNKIDVNTNAVEKNTLLPEEYIQLREDAGWGCPEKKDAIKALEKCLVTFVKRQEGKIAGAVRVVGDDKLCFYIQDLIVLKQMRKQGIASELMRKVMEYINENAAPNAFIGLMAAKGIDGFYEKYGFIRRPNEQMGPGMIMYHGRPGQLSED